MSENEQAMVIVQAGTPDVLRDAVALLRLGVGELLSDMGEQMCDTQFLGTLEVGQIRSVTPMLLALLRSLLLAPPTQRNVAIVAGKIWLTSHCAICGCLVEEARHSPTGDALCPSCEQLNNRPGALDRLSKVEQVTIDQQTVMAFLKDPGTSETDRDQFYMLMMARELANTSRNGYAKHGRGAVILDQTGDRPFAAYYVDETTARESGVGWPHSQAELWVAEYDPAREMVLVFIKPGNTPVVYRLKLDAEPDAGKANPFAPARKKPVAA